MTSATLPIGHIEIPVHDLAVATQFYRDAFSWDIEESAHTNSEMCHFSCGDYSGSFKASGTPSDKGILPYIRATNMTETLAMIERCGGTILSKKTAVPGGRGYLGYFLDPSGNRLGLWSED